MSDDDTHAKLASFDKEPSTGEPIHVRQSQPEHADLKHRIEVDALDEREQSAPAVSSTPKEPVSQPVVTPTAVQADELPHAGPGVLVLQWLVYAFWGWTVFALSGLIFLVVNQLLEKNDAGISYWFNGGIAYVLAAVIVLFIISFACDVFYAKAEHRHARSSGTNVIMIIHAVIFALFGIGALIMSVFGGVSLLIGETTDTTGAMTIIISGGIIFLLYAVTLLRTLRPGWVRGVVQIYWVIMIISVIAAVTLGIVGPAAQARLRAQDMVLEEGLPPLAAAINTYTSEKSQLPLSLSDLESLNESDYTNSAQKLVDEKLVTYVAGEKLSSPRSNTMIFGEQMNQLGGVSPVVYHYELCVVYKASDGYEDDYDYTPEDQKYYVGVNTFGHKAGKVCYDAQTDYTN